MPISAGMKGDLTKEGFSSYSPENECLNSVHLEVQTFVLGMPEADSCLWPLALAESFLLMQAL